MNKQDKTIIIYFVVVAFTTIIVITLMNYHIGNTILPEETVTKISFVRIVDVNKKEIFNTMADIERYPIILPNNFLSVRIINQTSNTTYAEEEVIERGIKTRLIVKHTISPYDNHTLEVVSGDAQGTMITEIYEEIGNSTKLTTNIEMHLRGVLMPFGFLAQSNLENAMNTVITSFVEYAKKDL